CSSQQQPTPGCPVDIFTNQGELSQPNPFPYGTVKMPTPFPVLVPPAFFDNGPPRVGSATLDTSQVERFFYDSLCACIARGDRTRHCTRDGDCCPVEGVLVVC